VGIFTVEAVVVAVMVFKKRGKNASLGYNKKYNRKSKRGLSPVNSVPREAQPHSKKKYKPTPTKMLSEPDSVITPFQRRMMIGTALR
jgi:hypothetical protein